MNSRTLPKTKLQAEKTELAKAINRALRVSGTAVMLSMAVPPIAFAQSTSDAAIQLEDLDNGDGIIITEVSAYEYSGVVVSSAGDINGDGIDDVMLGMWGGYVFDAAGTEHKGATYIVFGDEDVDSIGETDLSDLDGSNGVVIIGLREVGNLDTRTTGGTGDEISNVGDINGDGIDDIVIGSGGYVVFGGSVLGNQGLLDLADLDGTNGFVVNDANANTDPAIGVTGVRLRGAFSGAGDINGDGLDDLVIGESFADPDGRENAGKTYIVFGDVSLGATGEFDLSNLNGNNGIVINGALPRQRSGTQVSVAGDINSDGFDDLLIGALGESIPGDQVDDMSQSYVVFGNDFAGSDGQFDLNDLNGTNGFVISGLLESERRQEFVSDAGDVNADGIDDLIISASFADSDGNEDAGESYVIFGNQSAGSNGSIDVSELDGTNGFVVKGIAAGDRSGESVSSAGDFNGDGIDDLIIGAPYANPDGLSSEAGQTYVIFGDEQLGASGTVRLSDLDASSGVVMNAPDFLRSGTSVSEAGDLNGDGLSDVIIGAFYGMGSNEQYIVFGRPSPELCNGLVVTVDLSLGQTPTAGDDVIWGTNGTDTIFGMTGNDTICGRGGDDIIRGDLGNDWIAGGGGDDDLRGGPGTDTIIGSVGDDVIYGDAGADTLFGGPGFDTLFGNNGNDILRGGDGDDKLNGNAGNDLINGGSGSDDIRGGAGNDNLQGADDDDVLRGGGGNDLIFGGNGDDSLRGWTGDDELSGSAGLDNCDGGPGDGDIIAASCEVVTP